TWSVINGTGSATINASGLLTAVTNGTVTVKATSVSTGTVNGTAVITISNQVTAVSAININEDDQNLAVGATLQLSVTFTPTSPTNTNRTWASSSKNFATVDENGLVEAVAEGTVTITVTSADGGHEGTVTITVVLPVYNSTNKTYYDTIQAAIGDADLGDTIEVAAGIYNEDVTIDSALTLQGAGWDSTTIQGQAGGNGALIISSSNVTVDGFTIEGAPQGKKTVTINVGTSNVTFTNNKVVTADNVNEENGWAGFETFSPTEQSNLVIDSNIFEAILLHNLSISTLMLTTSNS
ncbi:unnamed protein product, partial [marine sediment metagenome]